MNKTVIQLLEYDKIKEHLLSYAISNQGRELIHRLQPSFDKATIEKWMEETTQSKKIMDKGFGVPLHSLNGIENILIKLGKGNVMQPEELFILMGLLRDGAKLKKFMKDKEYIAPMVSSYALSINPLEDVVEEINRCIVNGRVDDGASVELARTRKKIASVETKIKEKLDKIIKSSAYRTYLQDALVSQRGGRYVIPVKSEYRKNIEGSVLDSSMSGATLFIEPKDIAKYQDELNLLKIQEENEVYRILSSLTVMVDGYRREITINIETMAHYDFIFAKAKYSKGIDGNPVKLNNSAYISIIKGKHPLIGKEAVPLNFNIGRDYKALVITGPNTGGKTVTLKTVGLLTMMVQSGLHVPASEQSEFAIFLDILVDIGDGQSIEQSLSTFSSHIKNIIGIMECASPNTLVIMDEMGAGTDPQEGQGLAMAVLEEIYSKGATILATTHYSEIKEFASKTQGFKNGCMDFDISTLKPLYKLKIGEAGQSNAFLIALRLGMNKELIERAHKITYNEDKGYSNYQEQVPAEKVVNADILESNILQYQRSKDLQQVRRNIEKQKVESIYKLGDCVYVTTLDKTGIVCELENAKGEVGVMVMKKKLKINKKRLSLYIEGEQLYPEGYDFDIVFESKENRKKKNLMEKGVVKDITIEY